MGASDFLQAAKQAAGRAKGAIDKGGDAAGSVIGRGRDAVEATMHKGREFGDAAVAQGAEVATTAVGVATKAVGKGAARSADAAAAAVLLVPQRLESIGNPELPLASAWGMGFGQFVSGIDGVPEVFGPVLARLDQIGSVTVTPTNLEIDGESLEWRNVQGVTLGTPLDALSSKAAAEAVERLRKVLPAFPGRKFVVQQAVELLIAISLAVIRSVADRAESEPVQVVTSVRYAGRLRKREIRPGFFALLLGAMKPTIAAAIVDMSSPFGAVVTIATPSQAATRAVRMQDFVQQLRQQVAGEQDDNSTAEAPKGISS